MSKRNLLAAFLGALAMFAWSALAHMVLPIASLGIKEIPNEPSVLAAMKGAMGETPGFYIFPGLGTPPMATTDYAARVASNPSGLLIYHPPGEKTLSSGQLGVEFATEAAECLVVVWLLAQTSLTGFARRAGFVFVAGVLAAIATNISYWNWYGFPGIYTAGYMTTEILGFAFAGMVIAAATRFRR